MEFKLSEVEEKAYRKWDEEHQRHCSEDKSSRSFEFFPTSIGCAIKVNCTCGRSIDVTDLDSW